MESRGGVDTEYAVEANRLSTRTIKQSVVFSIDDTNVSG
ncbi:hypothetical protein FDI40_gp702 [Agrobacterium phage Atu_ph07]|uniref:Uncharacterized protein n=1 Tax=Agrobacterium phage Atu_ph07 TaxID=2024264 RepID=A0A2L0V0Z5_9CAUD|nr:hypothetical protein FDI40_gp702 [Agrobacterium phage Atu_ph07]AUZ95441.1 hypothetical protein [Agrobacterium phage Atu_ph07]